MKPQNLVTGLPIAPSGGGVVSAARCTPGSRSASWSSAARRRALDRLHLEAGDRAGRACRMRRRGPCWRATAMARPSTPGPPTIELYRTETAQLSRQSRLRRAAAVGRVAADRSRAALRARRGDRRSGRGRSLDRSRQRSRRRGADAGAGARDGRGLRRRASRRAAVRTSASATAPIRRRWRGAGRCAKERDEMSDPENFLARWSRRKRDAVEDARRSGRASAAERERRRRRRARADAMTDAATRRRAGAMPIRPEPAVRSHAAAAARIDHRRDRHPRLPGARRAGGA